MALPTSGQLSLNDIRVEQGISQTNVSLGSMSDTAGFFEPPDAVSDFYGYTSALWIVGGGFALVNCSSTTTSQAIHNGSGKYPVVGDLFSDLLGFPLASGNYAVSLTQGGTVYQTMSLGGRGYFNNEVRIVNIC